MFKVVKEHPEHWGITLLRNVNASPTIFRKNQDIFEHTEEGDSALFRTVGNSIPQSTRRFMSQDWNIRVRICSTVSMVSSWMMRKPFRVSILLEKIHHLKTTAIHAVINFSVLDEDGDFARARHCSVLNQLNPAVFAVTSELTLSHMWAVTDLSRFFFFSKIPCAFLTSFTCFLSVSVTFVTLRVFCG